MARAKTSQLLEIGFLATFVVVIFFAAPLSASRPHGLSNKKAAAMFASKGSRHGASSGTITESETMAKPSFYELLKAEPTSGCVAKIEADGSPFKGRWLAADTYCVCINRGDQTTTEEKENRRKICHLQAEFVSQAIWANEKGVAKWTGQAGKLAGKDGALKDDDLSNFYYDGKLSSVKFTAKTDFASGGNGAAKATMETCTMNVASSEFRVSQANNADKIGADFQEGKGKEKAAEVAAQLGLGTQAGIDQQREAACKILAAAAQATLTQLATDKVELKTMPRLKTSNEELF